MLRDARHGIDKSPPWLASYHAKEKPNTASHQTLWTLKFHHASSQVESIAEAWYRVDLTYKSANTMWQTRWLSEPTPNKIEPIIKLISESCFILIDTNVGYIYNFFLGGGGMLIRRLLYLKSRATCNDLCSFGSSETIACLESQSERKK